MGDPRGIGPEVALAALAEATPGSFHRVRLVGVREVFQRAAFERGLTTLFHRYAEDLLEIRDPLDESGPDPGRILLMELPHPFGTLTPDQAGRWAGRAVQAAVRELRPELGDALVTAPIDKHALALGGYAFPGHTEFLAHLAGSRAVAMMLVAGALRVSLVTGHVPLAAVPAEVTPERIRQVFALTRDALRAGFGIEAPRIALCGLNPHAGDGGALGSEEMRILEPLVAELRGEGGDVTGPVPGDTAFVRAVQGEFDAVLALYHDQGMIPIKLHGFGAGVNVTLGLPFVRTSPDHGTALELAGTGRARADSFRLALQLARDLADRPGFTQPGLQGSFGLVT